MAYRKVLAAATVAAILWFSSCTVTCDAGYEGKNCNTATNAKFAGTYSITDTAVTGTNIQVLNYNMTISAAADPSAIFVSNLHNFGNSTGVQATVSGTSINIPVTMIDSLTVSGGMGSLNDSTVSIFYTLSDTSFLQNCHAVGKK